MMKKFFLFVGIVFLFLASGYVFARKSYASENGVVPGSYIVVFRDGVSAPADVANDIAKQHGLSTAYVYSHALKGFSATIPEAKLRLIEKDPRVAFVSQDRVVSASVDADAPVVKGKQAPSPTPVPPQVIPTGVARIGVGSHTGAGVGVAVIDTGIDLDHPDLAVNIAGKYSCIRRKTGDDDNGHGTHVAGTIAGVNNAQGVLGVAPGASLYAVKVLDARGSGTWSSVICGVDWVTANASSIDIANMSLGGGGSSDNDCGNTNGDALHKAICKSRDAGVTYVVAAGNESDNTSNHVPAAYDDAVITVSALADSDGASGGLGNPTSYGADDTFATFSNYGSAVDLGAPGVSIYSTWKGGGYNTISGTSMATPHVAGAAALYAQAYPGSSWIQIRDGLRSLGEAADAGHTGSSVHPEPVVLTGTL